MHECKFREYRQTRTVWACQMDRPFTVRTKHNEITGQAGDYLILTQDGEMVPVRKTDFEGGGFKLSECPREYCEGTDCECARTIQRLLQQSDHQLLKK